VAAAPADSGTDLYFGVGRSSTVRLTEVDTGYQIRNNGLPEAQISPRGAPPVFHPWHWMATLPVIARPHAQSLLVVGLGGGVALERLPPTLREVHVVELEEKVITANRLVSATRAHDPLADPRVTVVINDARNALRLTGRRYDIIVSQPSHPWTAGASHLFTTEFAALAKSRLNPDGVFVQWMAPSFLDTDLLKSLLATLTGVYTHVRVYFPWPTELLFLASDSPLNLEEAVGRAAALPALSEHLQAAGIGGREDLLAALALDEAAAARFGAGAPPSSDDFNLMATRSRYREDGLNVRGFYDAIAAVDPLASREFWRGIQHIEPAINPVYMSLRLRDMQGTGPRIRRLAGALNDPIQAQIAEAVSLVSSRQTGLARDKLRQVLAADPANQEARWLLLATRLNAVLSGTAPRELQSEADRLTGVPAAVLGALRQEKAGAWPEVAKLDGVLSEARPTDPWFFDAVRLRAGWRLQPDRGDRRALAAEALALTESILLLRSDVPLLVQRARAAGILGDAAPALEASAYVANHIKALLRQTSRPGRLLPQGARVGLGVALRTVAELLEAHPEWRRQPRGETVYRLVEEARTQFLVQ
jgi:hypothetical protein